MSSEENNFEDLIRSKLDEHTVEVSESVWAGIEKRKKDKGALNWFKHHLNVFIALNAFIVLSIAALLFYNTNDALSENKNEYQDLIIENELHTNQTTIAASESKELSSPNTFASKSKNKEQQVESEITNEAALTTNQTDIAQAKTTVTELQRTNAAPSKRNTSIAQAKSATAETPKTKSNSVKSNTAQAPLLTTKQPAKTVQQESSESVQPMLLASIQKINYHTVNNSESPFYNEVKAAPDELILAPSVIKNKSGRAYNKQVKTTNKAIAKEAEAAIAATNLTNTPSVQQQNEVQIIKVSNGGNTELTTTTNAELDDVSPAFDTVYKKRKFTGYLAIDALVAPEIVWRKLNGNTDEANAFIQRRDSTEKARLSYSGSIRLNLFLTKNVFISSGIQYAQYSEKFSIKHQWKTREDYIDSSKYVSYIDPFMGTTIFKTYDTLDYYRTHKEEVMHNISFSRLDVPTLIGYKWLGKKAGIALQAGVLWNLLFTQKGTLATLQYQANDVKNAPVLPYQSKLGISLAAGVSTNIKLSSKIDLLIEPNARYTLKSITTAQLPIAQKSFAFGLNTGLRFKL